MESTLRGDERPVRAAAGRSRKTLLRISLSLAVVALGLAFASWIGLFGGNFRTVVAGRVYRSGQLSPERLRAEISEHGIRTVLNLQGRDRGEDVHDAEGPVCESAGATYIKVPLSAGQLPTPSRVERLVKALDSAQYPLLIHCRAGADRSGLVAALYLALREGVPPAQAHRTQLTWTMGHFPFQAAAMDRFFELYQQTSGGQDLRDWISRSYPEVWERVTGKRESAPSKRAAMAR
jgi:uncharacterized protein (TIGR01244 family)